MFHHLAPLLSTTRNIYIFSGQLKSSTCIYRVEQTTGIEVICRTNYGYYTPVSTEGCTSCVYEYTYVNMITTTMKLAAESRVSLSWKN